MGSWRAGFSSGRSWALEHGLTGCGAQALLLRSLWNLAITGFEPVSPALAGRFFTTEPPGKSPLSRIDILSRYL